MKDPACSFRIVSISIVVRKFKTAFGGPVLDLGLMLVAIVTLQCCLPLATAFNSAVPLCWCAAVGLTAAWEDAWAARGPGPALILGVFAVCALPWLGARLYLQESGIRQVPKFYNCRALKEIERFKPFTQFMFTDQPIYPFHSGIPVLPRLAIPSLKRILDLPSRWVEGLESRVNVWRTIREDLAGMRRLRHSLRRLEHRNPVRLQTPSCLRA